MVHLSRIFGGKRITSSCLVSAGRRSAGLMGSKDEERSATELLDMHDLMFGGPSRFHSSASNHRIWKEMVSDSKHVTRKSCMLFSLHRMPMIHSLGKATAFTHFFTFMFLFLLFFVFVARHHKNALVYKHLLSPNHPQKVKSKAGISQSFSHSRQYNKNKILFTHCKQHK